MSACWCGFGMAGAPFFSSLVLLGPSANERGEETPPTMGSKPHALDVWSRARCAHLAHAFRRPFNVPAIGPASIAKSFMRRALLVAAVVALLPCIINAKISELVVEDDPRRLFAIESFGFRAGGVHSMELSNLRVPLPIVCGRGGRHSRNFFLCVWVCVQIKGSARDLRNPPPHAGFVFKRSTPDATTQMEESYSEGLCMLDQKNPGDVFIPLHEKSRCHLGCSQHCPDSFRLLQQSRHHRRRRIPPLFLQLREGYSDLLSGVCSDCDNTFVMIDGTSSSKSFNSIPVHATCLLVRCVLCGRPTICALKSLRRGTSSAGIWVHFSMLGGCPCCVDIPAGKPSVVPPSRRQFSEASRCRQNVKKIHGMMALVVSCKFLSVFFEAVSACYDRRR